MEVPRRYQQLYNSAMSGRSRKDAMKCQCLYCCGWEILEVFKCTDTTCPMYPYRPASRVSTVAPEALPELAESKKDEQLALMAD